MPEGCEKMSKQGDAAYAWFLKGYNCSQSVVAAFAPQLGLTEETALRLSAGFGAGIGRMREVCGAFCGVVTVLSMVYADPADPKDKSRMYALVQEAAEQYRSRNGGGSIICRELLGLARPEGTPQAEARTPEYYKKRPARSWWRWRLKFWRNGWPSIPPGCKFRIPTKYGSLILVYFTIINLLDDINLTIIDNSGVCTVL